MTDNAPPTIVDVAREAGVSPATVSRVLNDASNVSAASHQRVLDAIDHLGYTRLRISKSNGTLAPQREQIALVITDILNPFFPEMIRGIEDEIGTKSTDLLLYNTAEDNAKELAILETLAQGHVSGVIVSASRVASDDLIQLHSQHQLPIVVINRQIRHPGIPSITIDFADSTYRAAQHLLNLSHRRIGYLARHTDSETSQERRKGIECALAEVGLRVPDAWCPNAFPNVEGGFQAMSGLLSLAETERPTAVIAYNDLMAVGALNAIRSHGLRVPHDISVIGFDDITIASHTNPPLTTIYQPKYHMGQLAIRLLRQRITRQPVQNEYILIESPLIMRQSTGVAAQTGPQPR